MAYMSQDRKKQIATELKQVLKGTGIKYTLGVRHHSTIVMNIKAGPIDFIKNYNETVGNRSLNYPVKEQYMQVNTFWTHEHFSGEAKDILGKIIKTLNNGNHNNSDPMTDYFDVGWYVDVNVGRWNKPYVLTEK